MSKTLDQLIEECFALKQGNKEFALFGMEEFGWRAEIGNPSSWVMLGESNGEFTGVGVTPAEALESLIVNLKEKE
jgi:hypothetical protein